jgi:hypothetical protein
MAQALLITAAAVSAYGTLQEGAAAESAAKAAARQGVKNAKASQAEGLRRAAEITRQGDVLQSDAVASMVAGGGVSDDVGAIRTLADIEQVTNYNALSALFESRSRASQQEYAARVMREEGHQARKASYVRAGATALQGGAYAYGIGGPKTTSAAASAYTLGNTSGWTASARVK